MDLDLAVGINWFVTGSGWRLREMKMKIEILMTGLQFLLGKDKEREKTGEMNNVKAVKEAWKRTVQMKAVELFAKRTGTESAIDLTLVSDSLAYWHRYLLMGSS